MARAAAGVELRAVDAECWEGVRDGGIPRVAASWRVGVTVPVSRPPCRIP